MVDNLVDSFFKNMVDNTRESKALQPDRIARNSSRMIEAIVKKFAQQSGKFDVVDKIIGIIPADIKNMVLSSLKPSA